MKLFLRDCYCFLFVLFDLNSFFLGYCSALTQICSNSQRDGHATREAHSQSEKNNSCRHAQQSGHQRAGRSVSGFFCLFLFFLSSSLDLNREGDQDQCESAGERNASQHHQGDDKGRHARQSQSCPETQSGSRWFGLRVSRPLASDAARVWHAARRGSFFLLLFLLVSGHLGGRR